MLRALTRAASVQLRPGSSIGHLPDRRLKTKASSLDSRRKEALRGVHRLRLLSDSIYRCSDAQNNSKPLPLATAAQFATCSQVGSRRSAPSSTSSRARTGTCLGAPNGGVVRARFSKIRRRGRSSKVAVALGIGCVGWWKSTNSAILSPSTIPTLSSPSFSLV
ncbi:hypothetical protein GQ607_003690 [Colletotrichum asianum]|uniref:Uncharacterized protein n=1 Tax=Colletotrichum asianum TaxID=702518 RepID=A0A8H3WNF5_9PEZI|nr:hypothetical protein GQ607_003690 [Colletotrichum asianum]